MNLEKLRSPARATFKNSGFQSFHELTKRFKVEPSETFRNLNLNLRVNGEIVSPNLSFTVENKDGNLHKESLDIFRAKHHE